MDAELKSLQIDRGPRSSGQPSRWAVRWIIVGIAIFLLLGAWRLFSGKLDTAPVVDVQRVNAMSAASAPEGVVLNAAGYIVAAHRIEVAAKVIGKVKWIGVDKGDHVQEGQVIVRLEDDEYQAQLQQAKGQMANLEAKLAEALHGSRPEEVAQALANLDSAKADMDDAKLSIDRANKLLPDRARGQSHIAHLHHVLDPGHRIACRVGMDGGHAAVVAGVHGLQHVEGFRSAYLAHDDAVGPHAQCVMDQVALSDLAAPLQTGWAGFHPHHMRLLQLQFGCVLDRNDAFAVVDQPRHGIQQRGLAGASTT